MMVSYTLSKNCIMEVPDGLSEEALEEYVNENHDEENEIGWNGCSDISIMDEE